MSDYLLGWVQFIFAATMCAWAVTEILARTCPHMTRRVRWETVAYLIFAISFASHAWRWGQ